MRKIERRYTSSKFDPYHQMCSVFRSLIVALLAGMFATGAWAFGSIDPFGTAAIAPPRPNLTAEAAGSYLPCKVLPPGSTYGLIEVVDLSLCQNPNTHEVWANARVQAAQVGVAQSGFLPKLDGSLAASRVRSQGENSTSRGASLTLSWLIYDFGARSANLESARQLLSAATSTLDATVQSVFLAALQSYYNTQAARAAVIAAQESERASRESFTAAEARYRIGTGTPADRLQAQTAWSQATLNRIKAEGVARIAYGTLANVMGLNAGLPLQLAEIPEVTPSATIERDIDALIAEAQQRRPDLKAAEAQLKAAQANVDYARASGLPTFALSAGPSWTDAGGITTNSSAIGVTLTLPLFSGFNTNYRVRSARASADAAGAQRDSLRLQVALDVWSAYHSLVTATQSVKTASDLLSSAEQSERVALGRYKAGVGNILDVLNAQSALAAARVQRIQATLDWNVFRATLAKALGTLDSSLLDPAAESKTQ